MLIKNLKEYNSIYGKIDAILITNKNNIIEYSAITGADGNIKTEDIISKNIYEVYKNLNEKNSTHAKVLKTGLPVINQKQTIVEKSGKTYVINTSTFPIESGGEILGTIAISSNLSVQNDNNNKKSKEELYSLESIITCNREMTYIKEKSYRAAQTIAPVLVIGESGTGKELVVEGIHNASSRRDKPFISLNCAAVPETLMESTLFGTVKGSFTGAENKRGLFELANGGTLFLDELNSMSLEMQAKLLKAVEEQRFMRIGGEKYINVDVRMISAMNVSPQVAIDNNNLRTDLYYRLGVVQFNLPPLRERKEDIPDLLKHFIDQCNNKMGKHINGVDDVVLKALMDYEWPGNIRELRNVIESAISLIDERRDCITIDDIPEYVLSANYVNEHGCMQTYESGLSELVEDYEKNIIIKVLTMSKNVTEAARTLKLTRQVLKYKMNKYNISESIVKKHKK